jgi:hypothetical protein
MLAKRVRRSADNAQSAKWVKQALDKAHISHSELARRLEAELGRPVKRLAITYLRMGTRRLKFDEMQAIAKITGFPEMQATTLAEATDMRTSGLNEMRLLFLIAGALQHFGLGSVYADELARFMIEDARTSPERSESETRLEGETLARLFASKTVPRPRTRPS